MPEEHGGASFRSRRRIVWQPRHTCNVHALFGPDYDAVPWAGRRTTRRRYSASATSGSSASTGPLADGYTATVRHHSPCTAWSSSRARSPTSTLRHYAQLYGGSGRYTHNSGMFLGKPGVVLDDGGERCGQREPEGRGQTGHAADVARPARSPDRGDELPAAVQLPRRGWLSLLQRGAGVLPRSGELDDHVRFPERGVVAARRTGNADAVRADRLQVLETTAGKANRDRAADRGRHWHQLPPGVVHGELDTGQPRRLGNLEP